MMSSRLLAAPHMVLPPDIQQRIRDCQPDLIPVAGKRQASVALILRDLASHPKMFFIERAKHRNDPWSGQIAFPGGNREAADFNPLATACRETREEVGIELSPRNLLGRLDDQQGKIKNRKLPLVISCFVFHIEEEQQTINSSEVEDSFWAPVSHLLEDKNRIHFSPPGYCNETWPAVRLDEQRVLWGLTWRFVQMFLDLAA